MRLLKFSRPGCNPCVMMSNYLDDLGVKAEEVNVYEDANLANLYRIQSVPVLLLIDDEGNPVDQTIGFKTDEIDKVLKQYI